MTDYGAIVLGATGQVGSTVVSALMKSAHCREVLVITRRPMANTFGDRARVVVLDTDEPSFGQEVTALARGWTLPRIYAACCVGVGSGSAKWSEEELIRLEVGVVGEFARGCKAGGVTSFGLLTAAGANRRSRIRYARIMGQKEEAVQSIGFSRLAIFRPGIIAGNAHTPRLLAALGRLVPSRWGTVDQDAIGRAFVHEFENGSEGTTILHNREMRDG